MERISKEHLNDLMNARYYLNIAFEIAKRGTCLRRNSGSVIVNNDQIISTGYTGSPRNGINCIEKNFCECDKLNIKSGERYELCKSVHAEMNACIHAKRSDMIGGTLFLITINSNFLQLNNTEPCLLCKRILINSGILKVITRDLSNNLIVYNTNEWYGL